MSNLYKLCYKGLFPLNDIALGVLIALFIIFISFLVSRLFKKKLLVFYISLFMCLFVIVWQNYPETKRYNVDFELKEPVKIVELADFHHNATCPLITDIAISKCNKENPDIVVLLGDYKLNAGLNKCLDLPDKFFNQLKKIKAKKIYAVCGNHDKFEDEEKMAKKFKDLNIILCDQLTIKENGFLITGLDWNEPLIDKKVRVKYVYDDFREFQEICKKLPDGSKTVFLYHSPQMFLRYSYDKSIFDNKKVLFVTGHTHGGQVVFPFENKNKKAKKLFKINYLYGMVEKYKQKIIISKGIGNGSFPIRFGARPEVTVINLE